MHPPSSDKRVETLPEATILFAGDSGDGMQLTGSQFTLATAYARNDLATLPDFPAEIRAPAGTTYGVSGFQLHFGEVDIRTPGDEVDLLVAMNPAALKVNLRRVRPGGSIIVNVDAFEDKNLKLAGYDTNPLEDGSLRDYHVVPVELTRLTREALKDSPLNQKEIDRSKNMFALGLALWLYSRPIEPAIAWLNKKFAKKPVIRDANLELLKKGYHYGETTEQFLVRYEIRPAHLAPGTYRAIRGAEALALGLVAASRASGLPIFYGSYPITPASELLHELSRLKNFGVITFQAEDEIAAVGAAIGASFGGSLGVTGTSGPGLALKTEAIGLALMTELPLVVVDLQRGGPSTGLPTKTEQSDLLQALFGRNGDAPLPVLAASTPGDCFEVAYEACRIAVQYMTPVILLADGYLANGAEPWRIPDLDRLPPFSVRFADKPNHAHNGEAAFLPYVRDEATLARPWARPGTPGLEHRIGGLEKQHETGNVSYDPENHQLMTRLRAEKVERVAREYPPTEVFGDPEGDLLIIGWGSTRGTIEAAVETVRQRGRRVGSIHLRYLNPLPPDLKEHFGRFRHLLVPELNNGQLVRLLRDRYLLPFIPLNKVQGLPFTRSEIVGRINEILS
ncbi:2-oxoacid:acceptor oxidoreductase subunit alpha [Rhodocaloribacter litoris]|uniref:2-oxoacid:acceptor oxidoreductase subunit alpha n=1 Tax=Rhodocaloribacter litoris TaxID=2558931 RepID=UPI001422F309|nr:2-oxoacid:acceptor oxidoreductase subunit alpha [Rhodocaloribacter litoris]QXD15075.1 2-oxoacid:acceptor oxidoreductase subunit alpha [Rhodocaloribacter litoris]GIV62130.1 MAG: 2-oxoglutarate ferredoxin oxidoreductase subunit alpha [Rhodothermaceae bacterium]